MARLSDQVGKTVLSVNGAPLGKVERVLIDRERMSVIALVVRSRGLARRTRVVPFASVSSFGKEGPRLQTAKLPSRRAADGALAGRVGVLEDIAGWRVATTSGREIGRVCDFDFVGQDGSIKGVEASRGLVGDLASGSMRVSSQDIREIADETVVVRVTSERAETASQRIAGALGRGAGRAYVKAKEMTKKALDKLEDMDG